MKYLDLTDSLMLGWFAIVCVGLYLLAKKETNDNKIKKAEKFFKEIASRNK